MRHFTTFHGFFFFEYTQHTLGVLYHQLRAMTPGTRPVAILRVRACAQVQLLGGDTVFREFHLEFFYFHFCSVDRQSAGFSK